MNRDVLDRFEELAERARAETPSPAVDVSGRVINTLQSQRAKLRALEPELLIFAGGALAAACAAVLFFLLQSSYDQFLPLFQPFGVALK